jgi:hypothetical protein
MRAACSPADRLTGGILYRGVGWVAALAAVLFLLGVLGPSVPASAAPLPRIPTTNAEFLAAVAPDYESVYNMGGIQLRTDGRQLLVALADGHGRIHANVVDLRTKRIAPVSTNAGGTLEDADTSFAGYLGDGTQIALVSTSSNLTADPTNGAEQLYLKNTTTGQVVLLSAAAAATTADSVTRDVVISGDRNHLAYTLAQDWAHPERSARTFLYDVVSGQQRPVVPASGANGDGSGCVAQAMTRTGSRLLLLCPHDRWVLLDPTASDRVVTTLPFLGGGAALSPDGERIAYYGGDSKGFAAFVRDLRTGRTKKIGRCGDFIGASADLRWLACPVVFRNEPQDAIASTTSSTQWFIGSKHGKLGRDTSFQSFSVDQRSVVFMSSTNALGGPSRHWNVYVQRIS